MRAAAEARSKQPPKTAVEIAAEEAAEEVAVQAMHHKLEAGDEGDPEKRARLQAFLAEFKRSSWWLLFHKLVAIDQARAALDMSLTRTIEVTHGSPWWLFYHGAVMYLAEWNCENPEELAKKRKEMQKQKLKQQAMERVKADKAKAASEKMEQGVAPPAEDQADTGEAVINTEPLSPADRRAALEERLRAKKIAEETRAHEKKNDLQEGETEEEAVARRKEETKAKLMAEAKARVAKKKADAAAKS